MPGRNFMFLPNILKIYISTLVLSEVEEYVRSNPSFDYALLHSGWSGLRTSVIAFLILLSTSTTLFTKGQNNLDPFSKINIKSDRAICQKDKIKEKTYFFSYQQNVSVTFADESTINADEVQIELNTDNIQKQDFSSVVEQIKFKKNVKLKSKNKKIDADFAQVNLQKKTCYLTGNIKIEQLKEKSKDVPIITKCNKAFLSFETEKVTLLGTEQNPVNSIIEIEKSLIKKATKKKRKRRLI